MAGPGRSPVRAALSRLPGWLAALGLVLVLAELAGAAGVLAVGHGRQLHPHRGTARPSTGTPSPHSGTGAAGPIHTVVLRVDGPDAGCNAARSCGAWVQWQAPSGSGAENSQGMPFIKTIRVPAGAKVAVEATPYGNLARCSVTVDGTELSRVTTTENGHATCGSVVPPVMSTGLHSPTRPVVLQIGENLGDTVTYTAPGADGQVVLPPTTPSAPDDGNTVEPAVNVTKSVDVAGGGIVTIHAFSPTGDAIISTVTVAGAVVTSVKSGHSSDSWVRIP